MSDKRFGKVKSIDLTQQHFGRLLVLGRSVVRQQNRAALWHCLCRCGNEIVARSDALRSGKVVSCGCWKNEKLTARMTTHGMTKTRTFSAWQAMKKRCVSHPRYKGIIICKRWRQSFANFLADMGECPAGLTLDRINNKGNYEPANCRWATWKQQANNRSNNIHALFAA
jgi:hypothetical protein